MASAKKAATTRGRKVSSSALPKSQPARASKPRTTFAYLVRADEVIRRGVGFIGETLWFTVGADSKNRVADTKLALDLVRKKVGQKYGLDIDRCLNLPKSVPLNSVALAQPPKSYDAPKPFFGSFAHDQIAYRVMAAACKPGKTLRQSINESELRKLIDAAFKEAGI